MTPKVVLGIDIGGTNTAYGFVDKRGQILHKGSIPTVGHQSIGLFIEALYNELIPFIHDIGPRNIKGIGVGAPNANFYSGEIAFAPNLPWEGIIPLAKLLKEQFSMPVKITNDANAAALGEMTYGVAKGLKDFIMITLGTGVGSGVVCNGQLVYGHDGFAGEIGHVTAIRDGRPCGCGKKGCLETYCSATGIVRTAKEWIDKEDTYTSLREKYDTMISRDIWFAAKEGDQMALDIFEYTGKVLGEVLADMVAVTSPEAIVFFGGLTFSGNYIISPFRHHFEKNLLKIFKNKVGVLRSELPDSDSAILGASALAW